MSGRYLIALIILSNGCKSTSSNNKVDVDNVSCIRNIIDEDSRLGTKRNHDCETISLDQTVRLYTDSLENLNYDGCSKEFAEAFQLHIQAWKDISVVTKDYENLRGEMHALFDIISKGKDSVAFNTFLDNIWSTWSEVEKHIPASDDE